MYKHADLKHFSYKHIPLMLLAFAATPAFAQDFGFYGEIYGGARLGTPVSIYGESKDTSTTGVFGASLGLMTPIDGLAFELDFMRSKVDIDGDPSLTAQATTVMLNAEYSVHATDVFDIYAGLGVGSMSFVYNDGPSFSVAAQGTAYQVSVGARANMTENLAAFVEYKHVNTFSDLVNGADVFRYPSHYVLAGLRLSY